MRLHLEDGRLTVTRPSDEPRDRAMHGLTRALLANMVTGVDQGFRKTLELVGVGYRAQMQGDQARAGTRLLAPGGDRTAAGHHLRRSKGRACTSTASTRSRSARWPPNIRKLRPPEPYLGKGIRYPASSSAARRASQARAAR